MPVSKKRFIKNTLWAYLFIGPTIIGLFVLNVYPFIETLILSLSSTKAFGAYEFSGLDNFIKLFNNADFWKATWNTIYFCILTVPIGVILALIVAVLLNTKVKGRGVFRVIYFLPMVVPATAVAMVWRWLFNTEYGLINAIISGKISWLTNPAYVLPACAAVAIWSAVGYDAVLLLAGIQSVSKTYYEAAELDGATKIQQFFKITLPMVSPTLFFVTIMRVMASLKVYDLIYMMIDEGNPALPHAQSLMYLFYRESFVAGNKGYGSAIAVWTVLLIGIVTFIQFVGQKKWVNYDV